jgi:hypothetical protein
VTRHGIAGGILLLWAIGLGLLAHRQFSTTDQEQLAEGAEGLYPATYYYLVYQGDTAVGAALSAIDTAIGRTREFRITDRFRGRLTVAGEPRLLEAGSIAYLSRQFVLDSFALDVRGSRRPVQVRGAIPKAPTLLLPTLIPIAFMLRGHPSSQRPRSYAMYEPIGDSVSRVTLRPAAESLFTVSDSATYDSSIRQWVSAHTDTVRSWSVAPAASGFTVWVDAQGRIVSASGPTGLHMLRTAYEIAFSNLHLRHQ